MTITINGFSIVIQNIVPVIIGVTIFLVVLLKWFNSKLVKFDPLTKPTMPVLLCIELVNFAEGLVSSIDGEKLVDRMGPYIASLCIYIPCIEWISLLGFDAPATNWSVALVLAGITYIMIQKSSIKYGGLKSYIHGFFEPIFIMAIPNIFSNIAPLLSMSLRLFGNNVSGTIIMGLVYDLGNTISNAFWSIFGLKDIFNFVGPILAAPLHCYFDLFSGFIQMFIFIMLTMVLVGNNIPEDQK